MIGTLAEQLIEPSLWFGFTAVVMALGMGVFILALLGASAEERRYHLLLVAISGIAATAYAAMSLQIGWLPVGERLVFLPRYIDWLLTTPLLLAVLALLAKSDTGTTGILLGSNTAMILLGLGASVLDGPLRYGLFAAGFVAFLPIVYLLMGTLTRQAAATDSEKLFLALRNLTLVLWVVYPFVWIVGPAGLAVLTPTVDVLIISYLDVISKVGFGLIALSNAELLTSDGGSTATEAAV